MTPTGMATASSTFGYVLDGHSWPRQWHGEWIGPKPVTSAEERMGREARTADFTRHLYRAAVELESVPEKAPLRITADSRYVLYVNGQEVGRGPVRSQPRKLRYDSYDVAALLREGTNHFVVLVTYFGTANAFWQPAAGTGNFGSIGLMALEMQLGSSWFVSGEHWEVRHATAWTEPPRSGFSGGVPVELFDARLLEPDWIQGTAGEWNKSYAQPVVHLAGLGATRPPSDPYGALLPRPIGARGGDVVPPVAAAVGEGTTDHGGGENPVDHVLSQWHGIAMSLIPVEPDDVSFSETGPATRALSFDFGRVVVGHAAFTLDAPRGTIVDILYREAPDTSSAASGGHAPRAGARYIARGWDDTFVAQEVNGFRWASLLITLPEAGVVRLSGFRVKEYLSRPVGSSYFRSSAPSLDALYRAGIRTVEVNSLDAYTDCPTREQRSWVGDAVVQQMVTLTTSDDWRLPLWYIELANSPRSDGMLPMSVVGDLEHSQGFTIPEWSLYWLHGVHNIYRYTGDRSAVGAAAPTARRVLEWFAPYQTDEGVLSDVPEWTLVDWSSTFLNGASSILTAFWANELREFAEIADFLGNAGDAAWARALYAKAQAGYESFWDESRGTYIDHIVEGTTNPAASQLAGALAIVSGLAPGHRVNRIIDWISDTSRQVTRSWIGGDGTYDEDKIGQQLRGNRDIDWDTENETVVAQPFAAFFVHDAYAAAGRPDLILSSLQRWTAFLQDGWDTFGECWGWGTPAHGWSSTPTRDLVQSIVGVQPAQPGFTSARIAPAYGLIEKFEANVPTPFGYINVAVTGDEATVTSPVPYTLVDAQGKENNFPADQSGRTS